MGCFTRSQNPDVHIINVRIVLQQCSGALHVCRMGVEGPNVATIAQQRLRNNREYHVGGETRTSSFWYLPPGESAAETKLADRCGADRPGGGGWVCVELKSRPIEFLKSCCWLATKSKCNRSVREPRCIKSAASQVDKLLTNCKLVAWLWVEVVFQIANLDTHLQLLHHSM